MHSDLSFSRIDRLHCFLVSLLVIHDICCHRYFLFMCCAMRFEYPQWFSINGMMGFCDSHPSKAHEFFVVAQR